MATQGAARSKRRGRGLPKRQPTTSFYDVKVADDDEIEAAKSDLETAQGYSLLRLSSDKDMKAKADEMLVGAKARMRACFERLTFAEIDPADLDTLLTKFPHPDGEELDALPKDWQWPMIHHLASASCVDVEQSPDEWAAWCHGWSVANWTEFRDAVWAAQRRTATEGLPKG